MWDINYINAQSSDDLQNLPDGPVIIEIIPDAQSSEEFWKGML
jgi:hypothetical protein